MKIKANHYHLIICVSGMLTMFFSGGIAVSSISVFLPYIRLLNGFTNTQTNMLLTIRLAASAIAMTYLDRFIKKLGSKKCLLMGLLCSTTGFLIYAVSASISQYAMGAVLLGLGYTFGGMVVISSLLTNWFISKKAFAVSVCSAGSGLAPVIMAPVLTRLIEASGLKATFLFVAGSTVIAAVILWITVKNVPEEIGLSPYLTSADEKKGIRQYGEDLPCRTGILLLVAMFMNGFVCNSFTAQISSVFIEKGYTPLQASYLVSIMGIALVIGKLVYGKATDCFGTFGVALLFHVFLFVGCAFYSSAIPYYSLGVTAMIFGGMGEAIGSVGITALAYEFSSRETFVVNLKRMQLISMIGGMCGGVLPGIIADVTGYYRPITHVFMAATLINLTCLLTIKKVRGRI